MHLGGSAPGTRDGGGAAEQQYMPAGSGVSPPPRGLIGDLARAVAGIAHGTERLPGGRVVGP